MQNIEVYKLDRLPREVTQDLHSIHHLANQLGERVVEECNRYPNYRNNLHCALTINGYINFIEGFNAICQKHNFECNAESISEIQEHIELRIWEIFEFSDENRKKLQADYCELSVGARNSKYILCVSHYASVSVELIQQLLDNNQHLLAE
ncbi:hypothetical protein NB525_09715 [Vibrio alginolyticus]|uniref:hypothetical protein n=1 Tax=Vibrio harveyi group TaxID=717610 RepID=UPI00215C9090|nr:MULTISPECIES: hypothetical protein [Vibrio harveyi group]MCR9594272.1 hypothetical protein [Vibrio alginolyticus]